MEITDKYPILACGGVAYPGQEVKPVNGIGYAKEGGKITAIRCNGKIQVNGCPKEPATNYTRVI